MNESWLIHTWVMPRTWVTHFVKYTNESCHTYRTALCNTMPNTATRRNAQTHVENNAYYNTLLHAHFSALQNTASYCNTLQHTLQHTATHCNTLQHTATHCNTLQHIDSRRARTARAHAPHSWSAATSLLRNTSVWEHTSKSRTCVAVCCSVWQYVTVCCSVLQCGAACKNMLQWMRQHHCYGNVRKQIHF